MALHLHPVPNQTAINRAARADIHRRLREELAQEHHSGCTNAIGKREGLDSAPTKHHAQLQRSQHFKQTGEISP